LKLGYIVYIKIIKYIKLPYFAFSPIILTFILLCCRGFDSGAKQFHIVVSFSKRRHGYEN
jgi:hypothetical protein